MLLSALCRRYGIAYWLSRDGLTKTLRIMKLTGLLLLITILHVSAGTYGQTVTYSTRNAPLLRVLEAVHQQTGYSFFYDEGDLAGARPVTVDLKAVPLNQALEAILANQPVTFRIEGTVIDLLRRQRVMAAMPTVEPPGEVRGQIANSDGQPLAGATVYIRKLKKSGMTDAMGAFEMKDVPDGEYEVEVSYVGFESFTTTINVVNHEAVFSAALKQMMSKLDETVVKGYYTTTNRLNTGDVTTVTSKEIEQQPVANPLAAMEGRVQGLTISQTSGIPGGAFTVQIRGQNSLLNGNDPFYVIDGVPYASQTVNIINNSLVGNGQLYGYSNSGGNPLNYINLDDIESISILKDADATSIYGSRAANGAILITTKKGKAGDTRLDLNVYSGVGEVTRMMHLFNTPQYLAMRHEAFGNDAASPSPNSDYDLTFWDTTRSTNWQKALIGNKAHYDDAQASVSGGNENIQYLVGGGYHRETTVFPGTFADQKASAHFNLNSSSLNKRFKVSITASYMADMSNVPPVDLTFSALTLPPDAPALHNTDGSLNWDPATSGQLGTWTNPLSYLAYSYKGRTNNLLSNALVSYSVLPGLNISTSLGYTRTETSEIISNPTTSYDPGNHITSGTSKFNSTNAGSWIIEPQVNYSLELGKGVFKALIGTTFEENTTDGQGFSATGFSSDALLRDIQAASSITVQSDIGAVYKYNALFGRLNYPSWSTQHRKS